MEVEKKEFVAKYMRKFGYEKTANPNDKRNVFVNSQNNIIELKLDEYSALYSGSSSEILNFYTRFTNLYGAKEPIYNRNKANYFWAISSTEHHIKRTHSGLPSQLVKTMTQIMGNPVIKIGEMSEEEINELVYNIKLYDVVKKQQFPETLALGWGAFKVSAYDKKDKYPVIEWYGAKDVEFSFKHNKIDGFIFKDYYKKGDKDYELDEFRYCEDGNSYIKYALFETDKTGKKINVNLDTIEELKDLTDVVVLGLNKPLGVASVFYEDNTRRGYGKSIYESKADLFDDLDQSLSQRSETCRVSTPTEYIPSELLETNGKNDPILPQTYDRKYIKLQGIVDGDGKSMSQITTTQPKLNFDQYTAEQVSLMQECISGFISPATLGMDVSRKDNALAQREKEKTTTMTRTYLIEQQTPIISELIKQVLIFKNYIETNKWEYENTNEVKVVFKPYANPAFENISETLLPLFTYQAITEERFVELLYGDTLTLEEKKTEIEALKVLRLQNLQKFGKFGGGNNDNPVKSNMPDLDKRNVKDMRQLNQLQKDKKKNNDIALKTS